MDPTACYNELLLALRRDDRGEQNEYATSLLRWLERDGFFPVGVPKGDVLDTLLVTLDPYGNVNSFAKRVATVRDKLATA